MLQRRFGLSLLLALALPTLSIADETFTLSDGTDIVELRINGVSVGGTFRCIVEVVGEECDGLVPLPSALVSDVNLFFNINGPDEVLSDLYSIQGVTGSSDVHLVFVSDSDGGPFFFVPFVNGVSITEDGSVQTVAQISLSDGSKAIFQFQSDVSDVPEPRFLGVVSTLLAAMLFTAYRKRQSSQE